MTVTSLAKVRRGHAGNLRGLVREYDRTQDPAVIARAQVEAARIKSSERRAAKAVKAKRKNARAARRRT